MELGLTKRFIQRNNQIVICMQTANGIILINVIESSCVS